MYLSCLAFVSRSLRHEFFGCLHSGGFEVMVCLVTLTQPSTLLMISCSAGNWLVHCQRSLLLMTSELDTYKMFLKTELMSLRKLPIPSQSRVVSLISRWFCNNRTFSPLPLTFGLWTSICGVLNHLPHIVNVFTVKLQLALLVCLLSSLHVWTFSDCLPISNLIHAVRFSETLC